MHKAFLGVEPATIEWKQVEWREIEKNGAQQFAPYSPQFDDVYFNTQDGIAESKYVFIEGNQLEQRFAEQPDSFSIFETGFGSGLNFLLTANLWQQLNPSGHLNYYSVEQFPIQTSDLVRIYQELNLESDFFEPLIAQYPPLLPGVFPINISSNITLHLIFYPLEKALKEVALNNSQKIDAWFLDGFAPSKNPQMWHKGLWHFMALNAINEAPRQTSVATFTSASEVRKMLQHYGFEVTKRKGFGYKREMLAAKFAEKKLSTPKANLASDYSLPRQKPNKVAVIGAGLAGTSLAYQLNQQGVEVHIFDKSPQLAAGASKMPALLAMPNLSIDHNSFSQLTFAGLNSISDFLSKHPYLLRADKAVQLASEKYSEFQLKNYLDIYQNRIDIKKSAKSSLYDFAIELMALQVNGPELCDAFIRQIPIQQIHLNSKVRNLDQLQEFDQIVIATGYSDLLQTIGLQLPSVMPLRGQITAVKAKYSLGHPINYDGHLFQEKEDWILGATFETNHDDSLNKDDDLLNIEQANRQFALGLSSSKISKSYAGIRASSFDRFPYCGFYTEHNGQNIWLNYGYGTRGLCLSLLGAEVISCAMLNKTLPISKTLLQKISPRR
ncbi:MAG: tRNA (5-methylaminomethyl-2-thiouridine)(34)-methyltransferase MnmD [Gammaproteobacteria bacterium]|nr:tRNA (5-methylaminomethyl-2-thiouridine)(34)-methyltransferase MnmD [Gammaproteobacteria bacterium]